MADLWEDVRYSYPATFHWQRMLNGNSGHFPMSYLKFYATMQRFPGGQSISFLQKRGVDYVLVHEEYYGSDSYRDIIAAIAQRPELREVAHARDNGGEARIYRLSK